MQRQAAKALVILVPLIAAAALLGWQLTKPAAPAPAGSSVCQARCHYVGVALTYMSQDHLTEFEQATDFKPGIVENYEAFGQPFPSTWVETLLAQGILPLIQLNPRLVTLRAIAAGRYDRYLSQFAAAVRVLGAPVGLSFGHKMNSSSVSWGYHHVLPHVFVAAWRHIHQVFAAVGARKVVWVWTVTHTGTPGDQQVAPDPRPWWPGGGYVNWIGLDIYYDSPAVTFQGKFVPTITAVRSFTDDPILLTETAVPNQSGQVHQIANLFAGARASHLMGIIWYNQDARHAWQLGKSRRAAITAFHRAATRMVASR